MRAKGWRRTKLKPASLPPPRPPRPVQKVTVAALGRESRGGGPLYIYISLVKYKYSEKQVLNLLLFFFILKKKNTVTPSPPYGLLALWLQGKGQGEGVKGGGNIKI